MKIRKIGVLSFAMFQAVFSAVMGLIAAVLMRLMMASLPQDSLIVEGQVASLTLGSAIMVIIQMAVLGFVVGILFAFVYNMLAKYTGGIELELSK